MPGRSASAQWAWIHPCPSQRMNIVDKALASDAAILGSQCLGEWTMDELLLLLDQMEQCNLEWYFRYACARLLTSVPGSRATALKHSDLEWQAWKAPYAAKCLSLAHAAGACPCARTLLCPAEAQPDHRSAIDRLHPSRALPCNQKPYLNLKPNLNLYVTTGTCGARWPRSMCWCYTSP